MSFVIWGFLYSEFPLTEVPLYITPPVAATLLSDEEFPELKRYIAAMKETDAVKDSLLSDEAHLGFINSFKSGTGNHDYSFADRTGEGVDIYTKKA